MALSSLLLTLLFTYSFCSQKITTLIHQRRTKMQRSVALSNLVQKWIQTSFFVFIFVIVKLGMVWIYYHIYGQQALQEDSPPNPFLSLLNGLGIFASGVLGSLYALDQKEKAASQTTIESVSYWYNFTADCLQCNDLMGMHLSILVEVSFTFILVFFPHKILNIKV